MFNKIQIIELFLLMLLIQYYTAFSQADILDTLHVTKDSIKVQKNLRNTIEVSFPFTAIKVPYKGFFKNNELLNLSMYGVQVNYFRNFRKSKHWSWGVNLAFEEYRVCFYNLNGVYKNATTPEEKAWYQNKYNTADAFTNHVMYNYDSQYRNLHDSMLKYYGGPTIYPFKTLRFGYSLKYSSQIWKKYTIHFAIESSSLIEGMKIGGKYVLKNKDYESDFGRVYLNNTFFLEDEGLLSWFIIIPVVFSPIYYTINLFTTTYSKIDRRFIDKNTDFLGLVKYNAGISRTISKNQNISVYFSLANLISNINTLKENKYNEVKPYYLYSFNMGCLGCPPIPYQNMGSIEVPIVPNLYKRFQLLVNYSYKF
ncbi:MAG TPA: hypothetical protein PK995_01405 [Bacteroidia bacterium]|nr:hypothetical protein [Bacteroidia bacterium]